MNIPYAMRRCTKCGEWLVANNYNFYKQKNGKWGLKSRCKKCDKQYYENNKEHIKEYRENNKEYFKEYVKQWREEKKDYRKEYEKQYRENNKERCKESEKKWRENNKEYKKEYVKQYYENNKEYIKEYKKKYRENNKEYFKEYVKQWREENKDYRKEYEKQWRENNFHNEFNRRNKRRIKLENQGRGITKEQWLEMFKFFDFKCAYSDISLGYKENRSIDHIIAIDNGGLNEPWNCIPMVKSYNSSKNKRVDVMNWYMEQEYFNEDRLNKIVEWQIYAYEKWGGEEFGELILITDLLED